MSLISKVMSDSLGIALGYDAAYSRMAGYTAETGLVRNAGGVDSKELVKADKDLAMQRIKDDLTRKIAEEMLRNKKKEQVSGFDTFS